MWTTAEISGRECGRQQRSVDRDVDDSRDQWTGMWMMAVIGGQGCGQRQRLVDGDVDKGRDWWTGT
jgi:hypothetical protein